jgi:hypothetical protein
MTGHTIKNELHIPAVNIPDTNGEIASKLSNWESLGKSFRNVSGSTSWDASVNGTV